jgi:predicted dehydrogenase
MRFSKRTAAVVGTGFIGPVHVEALRRIGINVKGMLGSTPAKSVLAKDQLGLAKAYATFEEILADNEVDVVHITSPNRYHRTMAASAINSGKHVVCEKPLATTSAETFELLDMAARNPRLVTAVNYNVRFYPLVLHARNLIQSGALGPVMTVRGDYSQDWLLKETDWNWRLLPEEGGELRAVGDIGTHWMDLILFVTGLDIESVFADLATLVPVRLRPKGALATFQTDDAGGGRVESEPIEIGTEDWGSVLFRFTNGARGTMCVSQVTAGRKNRITFEVACATASLAWDSEHPNDLWIGHRDKSNELLIRDPSLLAPEIRSFASYPGGHNEGFPDAFKQLYRAIYDYLAEKDYSRPRLFAGFEDGHKEMLLCEAILESHRAQRWVRVTNGGQSE